MSEALREQGIHFSLQSRNSFSFELVVRCELADLMLGFGESFGQGLQLSVANSDFIVHLQGVQLRPGLRGLKVVLGLTGGILVVGRLGC
jgi:hypothetical protein